MEQFRVWVGACSHIHSDLKFGRRSLAEAFEQSELGGTEGGPPFGWDIMLHLGDISGTQTPPADEDGPPGVTATIAGEVQLMFTAILHVSPHARAGKLRALGVTGGRRSPAAPDVPTIAEQGLPGYESVQWWMVMLPLRLQ